jgi:integrase
MARKRRRAKRGAAQIQCQPSKHGPPTFSTRVTEKVPGTKPRRVFITLKANTPEDAAIEVAEIKLRIKRGLPAVEQQATRAQATTIKALVESFCENYQSDDGVADIKKRRSDLRCVLEKHVAPFIGSADPETIKVEELRDFKDTLRENGRSNARVHRLIRDAQLMFRWAIQRNKLKRRDNPWQALEKPKVTSSTDFYREEEVAALLDWCERQGKHELHALVSFAFYTGARRGEIAAVRWSDVDWSNAKIEIRRSWKKDTRKNGEGHVVNLHKQLVATLKAHRARLGMLGDGLIFPSSKTDKDKQRTRMRTMNTLWGLDDAVKGADVRVMADPWHAFRHAHGTALAVRDASDAQIQSALGQKTPSMAKRYRHLAAGAAKKYVEALPSFDTKVVPIDGDRQQLGSSEVTPTEGSALK